MRKKSPPAPPSVNALMPSRPPGRSTRASSAAATAWRGANMQPKEESTTSKLSSSNGSASTSPSTQSTATPAALARDRAAGKCSGVRSTPVTRPPARAAGIATLPVPQATSSTASPGRTPARSTSRSPTSATSGAKRA